MSTVLAIDPGNAESGWCVIDGDTRRPLHFGKVDNDVLLDSFYDVDNASDWPRLDRVAIEMVASYGMAVGADVFETCVWIGRFTEALRRQGNEVDLIKRNPVKVHHCYSAKAKDSNIRQTLVDRFALGERNHGKGTKAEPGWFYGFHTDVWQAYALAVYVADVEAGYQP